jgi:hypothetical protein
MDLEEKHLLTLMSIRVGLGLQLAPNLHAVEELHKAEYIEGRPWGWALTSRGREATEGMRWTVAPAAEHNVSEEAS